MIKDFPIWYNVNFVSVFTALNNIKKQRTFNITQYKGNDMQEEADSLLHNTTRYTQHLYQFSKS